MTVMGSILPSASVHLKGYGDGRTEVWVRSPSYHTVMRDQLSITSQHDDMCLWVPITFGAYPSTSPTAISTTPPTEKLWQVRWCCVEGIAVPLVFRDWYIYQQSVKILYGCAKHQLTYLVLTVSSRIPEAASESWSLGVSRFIDPLPRVTKNKMISSETRCNLIFCTSLWHMVTWKGPFSVAWWHSRQRTDATGIHLECSPIKMIINAFKSWPRWSG